MFKISNDELKDVMRINSIKENLNKHLLKIIIFLSLIILIQSICLVFFFQAKKQVPYLIFYSKADQNFVKVEEANKIIKNSEAVRYLLLSTYVDKRESINRINDVQNLEDIRNQSNLAVWNDLITLIKNKNSIYNNNYITREVKIINISHITSNISQVHFVLTEYNNKQKTSTKQFRATIQYEFKEQKISYGDVPKNPLGFFVQKYGLSEIQDLTPGDENE